MAHHMQRVSLGFGHHAADLSGLLGPESSRSRCDVGHVWSKFGADLCTDVRLDYLADDTKAGCFDAFDNAVHESILRLIAAAIQVWYFWNWPLILLRSVHRWWRDCCRSHGCGENKVREIRRCGDFDLIEEFFQQTPRVCGEVYPQPSPDEIPLCTCYAKVY